MSYDYIIVGAGPSGLTLAYLFGKYGKKCLLIDQNSSVGGCHRVTRVNGFFTEHGPRVYSNSYKNTINLLEDMGYKFEDFFTPYNFSITNIGGDSLSHFTFTDKLKMGYEYLKFFTRIDCSKHISMESYMNDNNFSKSSKDYVDRLCRMTDGAGYKRYSKYQFLQLLNQEGFYSLQQPKKPNDIALFPKIMEAIEISGNVDVKLNSTVVKLNADKASNHISSVVLKDGTNIKCKNVILAIPPKNMYSLLLGNPETVNAFGDYDPIMKSWVIDSSYNQYIPITFHWNTKLSLPKVWGFPKTEWGIAFIVMSDYMSFDKSKTVISTCITMTNSKALLTENTPGLPVNRKTANEVNNKEELINEVLRQLRKSYPSLPQPTHSILSPEVKRVEKKWIVTDTAYMATWTSNFIKFKSKSISNLYNVGTQNGKSKYAFTSMESAITNSIEFFNEQNYTSYQMDLHYPTTVRKVLLIVLVVIIALILYRR